jgi:hypothetical protein
MTKVAAGITASLDGYIAGPTTGQHLRLLQSPDPHHLSRRAVNGSLHNPV